ncbi:MAG: hypothetical protein AABZ55_05160 [Bdellovibrionota bacterium]
MNGIFQFDLDHSRKRLNYYNGLKEKTPSAVVDKWVKIYSERLQKLERQISKTGLRTELVAGHSEEKTQSKKQIRRA